MVSSPWTAAMQALAGDPEAYPLPHCQTELSMLQSLLSPSTTNVGGSVLLLGPSSLTQLAALHSGDSRTRQTRRVVHLHGVVTSEAGAILSTLQSHLDIPHPLRTFEEMASVLAKTLDGGGRLVIVLQAFDRFAQSCQHFLYALFELAATHPVFVIGLSTRCDVTDMMEKRVKSRFSQNVIYVPHPKTLGLYVEVIRMALMGGGTGTKGNRSHKLYSESVARALDDQRVAHFLECRYEESRDPAAILSVFAEALCACDDTHSALDVDAVVASMEEWQEEVNTDRISELAVSEWCALIAHKRAHDKCPADPVTFDVLYDEYSHGFASSGRTQDGGALSRRFSRTVMRAAVDMLVARGLLTSARAHAGETIDTREELLPRLPAALLPDLTNASRTCPSPLKKLAAEVL